MIKLEMCFREYLANPEVSRGTNYMFIDPPWHYGMENSKLQINTANATKYAYWTKNNEQEVLNLLNSLPNSVDAIFIWTTNPMLEPTMRALFNSKNFHFRSLLTWEKTTVNGKQAKVMAHYFQNCTEFMVFAVRNKLNSPINRLMMPTHFSEMRGARTVKPKVIEKEIIEKMGGKWAYLFSGPFIQEFEGLDITCIDTCFETTVGQADER
jgi:N6-adenosine-specific RNA methylase IME4